MNFNKKVILTSMAVVPFFMGAANAQSNQGVVTAYALNVRSGPDKTYDIKFVICKDDKVTIEDSSNGWYKITTESGKQGWASAKYIDVVENQSTTIKIVSASSLNMRKGPSTSYAVITTLSRGQKVEVISIDSGWAKIKYNSKIGYVSNKYLKDEVDSNIKIKYVNTSSLNVRTGPSTSYEILTSYKYGQQVQVVSIDGNWAKIKYKDGYAYISNKYLTDEMPDDRNDTNSGNSEQGGTNTTYESLSYSFDTMVDYEYNLGQKGYNRIKANISSNYSDSSTYISPTKTDLRKYLNPDNFTSNSDGKLQFLRIDKYRPGITASELNAYFAKYCQSHSVFLNKGQAFIDAAKKYDLDVAYLVAASMVETGYGVSKLAQGVYVTDSSGNQVKVYNFFGISAYDGTAVSSASQYAYKKGWTSVDKTIDGSAKWLSDNYIHSSKYNQNTLYKMRWSYNTGHQYATDVTWAAYIGKLMNKIAVYYDDSTTLEYLIPKYK
ncbi:MAG: SH3 domain-containing protein [Intestinibacter sp.]|uniref:SH3 domain-containing protein n=1 Tax=Intestinibacter sp. TaxID=1965304 RepID=UPI003F161213